MATKNLLAYNFDESWNFDDVAHFDSGNRVTVEMVLDTEQDPTLTLLHNFSASQDLLLTVEAFYQGITAIDLLPLIPQKFHSSEMLQDYISVVDVGAGSVLDKIAELPDLVNPYVIGREYIGYLADLIGWKFVNEENATIDDLRRQLLYAVQFYKLKGTYPVFTLVAKMLNFDVTLYDMYTDPGLSLVVDSNDDQLIDSDDDMLTVGTGDPYSVFVEEPWFVANYEEENPPGLTDLHFKSPHFGFEILFNHLYTDSSESSATTYLWRDAQFVPVIPSIEQVRPINSVPHIWGRLDCQAPEVGGAYTIPETQVISTTLTDWNVVAQHFDDNWNLDDGSTHFDLSHENFIASITHFKVGTGNKGSSPDESGFALQNVVYSGSVYSGAELSDRYEFDLRIPANLAYSGLSELGLYSSDETTMVFASCFPDIDKTTDMGVRILITVTK